MYYQRHKVNGLDVVLVDMPASHATTIEIFVKAGSIYETSKTNGLSHFLEHMFFKWWIKYPTPALVAQAVDSFGGECNAYTGDEYSGYYITCAPRYMGQALDILADMLIHAQFPQPEMEREKWVVIQEIKMYEDNPQYLVRQKAQQWYLGKTPFGQTIAGPVSNVLWFRQEDLFAHRDNLYCKDNLVIVVAGKIGWMGKDDKARTESSASTSALLERIGELFGDLPERKKIVRPTFVGRLPVKHEWSFKKKTQQHHVVMMARWYDMFDETKYVADMLAHLLGWSMSSRLFQNVREKKWLCYYIGAGHVDNVDNGSFKIIAGMDRKKWEEWLQAIYDEVADLAWGNIGQKELDLVKGNVLWSTEMGIETSNQMAHFVWWQALFKDEIMNLDQMLHYYEKVTLSDLIAVATKVKQENLYAYWIG